MPSTITCNRGDVIVVNVPYSNHSGVKPRPALVVSPASFIAGSPMSSCRPNNSPSRATIAVPGRVTIRWQHGRTLASRHPSTVRVSKLLAVDKQIIKRVLGTVSPADSTCVDAALRSALGLAGRRERSDERREMTDEGCRMKVWFDEEADFLEVTFADHKGTFREIGPDLYERQVRFARQRHRGGDLQLP